MICNSLEKAKYFGLILVLMFFGSCAFHSGELESNVPSEPVEHRDLAIGITTTVKVFGMGGTNRDALIQEARQKMIFNRPLTEDESYNNTTVDVKTTFFLFIMKTKVTMTSDVIAPKKDLMDPSFTEEYLTKIEYGHSHYDSLFRVGDSVIFNLAVRGKIIGFDGKDNKKVRVQYRRKSGEMKNRLVRGIGTFVLAADYRGNRPIITRPLGYLIAYGVKGDVYQGTDQNYMYPHEEQY